MLKEIFEQPIALVNTIKDRLSNDHRSINLDELKSIHPVLTECQRLIIVACGTAYHAAVVAKYMIEEIIGLPVDVDIASEFRYRRIVFSDHCLVVLVSQSGETADTLAVLKKVKGQKIPTLAICNVLDSSIAREADAVLYTYAGPEIGVASTKAFISQIAALTIFMLGLAQIQRRLRPEEIEKYIHEMVALPTVMTTLLERAEDIRELARHCRNIKDMLFIGRHVHYPIALEAALKLKEISYLHAEGYAGGELKHGPIAIIDEKVLLVALIPEGMLAEKIISNMLEGKARDAIIMALTNIPEPTFQNEVDYLIPIPSSHYFLAPFLFIIPLQLFSYFIAEQLGLDIDKPRNLAKSVTVE